ncbi:L,D-transpeptidase family protein (plasmid) [Klebsiella sp. WOUb02]|uniref:L,D-transpeptidase family protein n=1 Tax=Klebsiella sp. WOUb02 TaxID=3161071 RepID=UPI003CEA4946
MDKTVKAPVADWGRRLTSVAFCLAGVMPATLLAANYPLPEPGSRLIGTNIEHIVDNDGGSLEAIAARYDVGLLAVMQANPDVDPFLPRAGTKLTIPSRMLLPDVPRDGITVNLAEMRLYYFPKNSREVRVYPVGIGQIDDETITPLMSTSVVQKRENPTWTPTTTIRKRYLEKGIVLPAVMPAGNDNPMGHHALRLGAHGGVYLIHGTNADFGIGMRVSSGCIRLRNPDIKELFKDVPVGTRVRIINEPVKVAVEPDGKKYAEVHQPVSERLSDDPRVRPIQLSPAVKSFREQSEISVPLFDSLLKIRSGLPQDVGSSASI